MGRNWGSGARGHELLMNVGVVACVRGGCGAVVVAIEKHELKIGFFHVPALLGFYRVFFAVFLTSRLFESFSEVFRNTTNIFGKQSKTTVDISGKKGC